MKGKIISKIAIFGLVCWMLSFLSMQVYARSFPELQWSQTFGGATLRDIDSGSSVQQTDDGGYIIAGETAYFGTVDADVYLIKTDSQGNKLWSKTFGGAAYDSANSVQQTDDGGYIIAGETVSFGVGEVDVYLIKTDSQGNELWSKTFGGGSHDVGSSVQQTGDGCYIIVGHTQSIGAGGRDIFMIKTNSQGNELWSKTFGGEADEYGWSVKQTDDGGYVIVGETESFGNGSGDVYLVKTDSGGNELWNKTFGGGSADYGYSVQQTGDGGYIVTGNTFSYGAGEVDVYLIKTDSQGNVLWSKTFGGEAEDVGSSVEQTEDGGYIITGATESFGNGSYDMYLIKTDTEGNELWSTTFGGEDYDYGASVQQTDDRGYIITGNTSSFGDGGKDVWLIKVHIVGDVNNDGYVNILDITKVERIIAQLDAQTTGADANGDGNINALDITRVERLIAGLD